MLDFFVLVLVFAVAAYGGYEFHEWRNRDKGE